jgi:glycosyltransferase involved in cell wall biosynthesis
LYRAHDFLLFPSRYEGFGKVAHEAMACGLAVVGTNVGVLTIRGVHGENALLCPAGDAAEFLGILRQATMQPELANTLGPRARAAVAGDTWAQTAKQGLDFIKQLRVN